MASRETAFTQRTMAASPGRPGGRGSPDAAGGARPSRNQPQQRTKPTRAPAPNGVIGAAAEEIESADVASGFSGSRRGGVLAGSGSRNIFRFSNHLTAMRPAAEEQVVAARAVPMMAEGFRDPAAASTAMADGNQLDRTGIDGQERA